MAIEYGVTSQGFVIKTLDIIKEEINEDLKSILGNQINLLPESVFGSLRDRFSERLHEIWELMQLVYSACYPNTAEDVSLDNICDYSLTKRLIAKPSVILIQALFGTTSTVIPQYTKISVEDDSSTVFETDEEVTLVAGVDEIQNIEFSITPTGGTFTLKYNTEETAALDYDATNTEVQTALNNLSSLSGIIVTGSIAADFVITFSGNDGKQPHPLLTVGTNSLTPSTTITITETTNGEYQGTVSMTCTETGPKNANAGTLNVIDNPLSGFTRTFNIDDAILGRNIESNAELRIRRNDSIVTSRSATVDAIRNKILDLNGDEYALLPELTDVVVYENDTDITDSKGIEPHRIMAVIRQAGDVTSRDQEIIDAIGSSKAAGIGTSYGNATGGDAVTGTYTDQTDVDHTIYFARPTKVDIYVTFDNFTTTSEYPSDGDNQLKTILVNWGNSLGVGIDIIVYPILVAQVAQIPGIIDFNIKIGTSPSPTTDNNIPISDGTTTPPEFSNWSTTNIIINHV